MKTNSIQRFFQSLKFRVFVLLVLIGIVPGIILESGLLKSYETRAVSTRSVSVQAQGKILANQLLTHNYIEDTSSPVINGELEQLSNMYDGRILIVDQEFKIIKDTYSLEESKTIISEEVIKCFKGEDVCKYDATNRYIELTVPVTHPDTKEILAVMLISVSTDSIVDSVESLDNNALVIQIALGLVIIIIAIFVSIVLIRPFAKITHSIEEVTTGYGDEKISVYNYTETGLISEAFNEMLGRMKVIDESREEFVSNVSHELKTPLTSMKVLADSLLSQDEVPVELYKEFLTDITDEIDRENKIINDLLSLVKMDKSVMDLNIAQININELLELILKRLRPIAVKQDIELVFESFRPVTAEIDEVKLTLAFSNLVENAIKYNQVDGWVHVSLNADHKYFFVKVEDSGLGIPEDSIEHIYERFFRVDKSHSREIGGTGLGLAITRNAILMHRGAIKVYSKEGEGTTFTVRVPLNYIT